MKPLYSTAKSPQKAAKGPIKMRVSTQGRGGKTATLLENLTLSQDADGAALLKALKEAVGCGGTFKDGVIMLQGDVRAQVEKYCAKAGLAVTRV